MKMLQLTLKKEWFDLMLSGEKTVEFREPSKWILSRLYNKDGSKKKYTHIKFTNGYGKDKPFFICHFDDCWTAYTSSPVKYSTGATAYKKAGHTIVILLGCVIESGNLKQAA